MTYLASVPSYMARRSYLTELAVVPTVIVANQVGPAVKLTRMLPMLLST